MVSNKKFKLLMEKLNEIESDLYGYVESIHSYIEELDYKISTLSHMIECKCDKCSVKIKKDKIYIVKVQGKREQKHLCKHCFDKENR